MNEMKVNVKAVNYEGMDLGYSYKENAVQQVQPELAYLPEVKVVKKVREFPTEIIILPFLPSIMKTVTEVIYTPLYTVFSHTSQFVASGTHTVASMLLPQQAVATLGPVALVTQVNLLKKLMPLIHVIQDIALPVSIIVASWGCIEWIVGSPGYKQKLKAAIVGYSALFGIPFLFQVLHDALQGLI